MAPIYTEFRITCPNDKELIERTQDYLKVYKRSFVRSKHFTSTQLEKFKVPFSNGILYDWEKKTRYI